MDNNEVILQSVQPETQKNLPNLVTGFIEKLSQNWEGLSPEKRIYFTQLGLLAAVQAVDTLTTYAAFQANIGGTELNPIAGFFLNKGGIVTLGLAKMGMAAGQIIAMEIVHNKRMEGKPTPTTINILRIANSFLTAVSVHNMAGIIATHLIMK